MKNFRKKLLGIVFLGLCSFLFAEDNAPYCFTSYKMKAGAIEGLTKYGYVEVFLKNLDEKKLVYYELILSVCDKNGEDPFTQTDNYFVCTVSLPIEGGETFGLAVKYETFFENEVIEEPLYLQSMYIRKAAYEDGRVWQDMGGFYSVSEDLP